MQRSRSANALDLDRVSIPSWIFCLLQRIAYSSSVLGRDGFNSVVDFLSIATVDLIDQQKTPCPFQFRRGFSVYCNTASYPPVSLLTDVSIPSWIFCLLQPQRPKLHKLRRKCFNSVVDFLSIATQPIEQPDRYCKSGFNSVVDFLSIATRIFWSLVSVFYCFNSVVDFLSIATPSARSLRPPTDMVSIPSWIFCLLQPEPVRTLYGDRIRFNSVVDFLSIATFGPRSDLLNDSSFNSVVDFLSIATVMRRYNGVTRTFQFRRGFSVYCNAAFHKRSADGDLFQFRRGFSVYCNRIHAS